MLALSKRGTAAVVASLYMKHGVVTLTNGSSSLIRLASGRESVRNARNLCHCSRQSTRERR